MGENALHAGVKNVETEFEKSEIPNRITELALDQNVKHCARDSFKLQ